jgi:hypothetical protein
MRRLTRVSRGETSEDGLLKAHRIYFATCVLLTVLFHGGFINMDNPVINQVGILIRKEYRLAVTKVKQNGCPIENPLIFIDMNTMIV